MNGVGKEIKCQSDFELFCLRDVNFPLENYKSVKNREAMLFYVHWINVIPKSVKFLLGMSEIFSSSNHYIHILSIKVVLNFKESSI